ncbi:MAG: protein-L-isoaspartate(D-aspartate) O-methyltransferase [Chromatiaceae bacterium]|nr:protein-L-isoaspartate(D-aspartate) O-methyltransferase [Gammaproteobacteria bacterium]MCB1786091.1 protein-L-isoaspartate(D-aspartate) O-methyltransferase [Gammaproteobacteria bacterium]MCP5307111.1 protein-L-isoaspartate(D-aspartate) O-methyltransferase [Chromatiaceae bacterium]MCP5312308.1 protein-L-isoaspartate(D-aspartate) O-methyltransferase [Chromatiaceae bacterium]
MTSQRTRERLIQRLREEGIRDPRVLERIRNTPRHLFVDEALASRAYEDTALPIGSGQTLSQPYIVARMTEALLQGGALENVLEVGTGSGYQTAVLAPLVRRVYTVERVKTLLDSARRRFQRLDMRNIVTKHTDGGLGLPEYAPFDGIIVTAAPEGIPRALVEQLRPGGCMVLPVGRREEQALVRVTRTADGYEHEMLERVSFVPLLDGVC